MRSSAQGAEGRTLDVSVGDDRPPAIDFSPLRVNEGLPLGEWVREAERGASLRMVGSRRADAILAA